MALINLVGVVSRLIASALIFPTRGLTNLNLRAFQTARKLFPYFGFFFAILEIAVKLSRRCAGGFYRGDTSQDAL